jgi:acyl transferase domain-containing protein
MEAASGIGGLIKVVLQLQARTVVPHLHLIRPNSRIPWDDIPIAIPTTLQQWPADDRKKGVAGVSSLGFTGTNAHVIVEEAPARIAPLRDRQERSRHVLALSAKADAALEQLAGAYASRLASASDTTVADVAYSASAGRSHFKHRLALVAATAPELTRKLDAFRRGEHLAGVFRGNPAAEHVKVAFVFSGEGLQYAGMGRELYRTQPLFRDILDRCDRGVRERCGWSLLDTLYAPDRADDLHRTTHAAPIVVALEYALAAVWRSWGIEPALLIGDGIGECAAAAVAGLLPIEDALQLVGDRRTFPATIAPASGRPLMEIVSSLTADVVSPDLLADPRYWQRHRSEPARLCEGIERVRALGCSVFLEVGPTPTLADRCRESVDPNVPWVASLSPERGDWDQLMQSVAEMYVSGVGIDWEAFDRGYARRRVSLPTYPFQRQRCWYTREQGAAARSRGAALVAETALMPGV